MSDPRISVLIVDDQETMHSILRRLLHEAGIRDIQNAYDGAEVIDGLKNNKFYPPDVIICDLHMDKMDGMEMINLLRRNRNQTPVLLLTGETNELVLDVSLQVGATKVLKKPISSEQLYAEIATAIGFAPKTDPRKTA